MGLSVEMLGIVIGAVFMLSCVIGYLLYRLTLGKTQARLAQINRRLAGIDTRRNIYKIELAQEPVPEPARENDEPPYESFAGFALSAENELPLPDTPDISPSSATVYDTYGSVNSPTAGTATSTGKPLPGTAADPVQAIFAQTNYDMYKSADSHDARRSNLISAHVDVGAATQQELYENTKGTRHEMPDSIRHMVRNEEKVGLQMQPLYVNETFDHTLQDSPSATHNAEPTEQRRYKNVSQGGLAAAKSMQHRSLGKSQSHNNNARTQTDFSKSGEYEEAKRSSWQSEIDKSSFVTPKAASKLPETAAAGDGRRSTQSRQYENFSPTISTLKKQPDDNLADSERLENAGRNFHTSDNTTRPDDINLQDVLKSTTLHEAPDDHSEPQHSYETVIPSSAAASMYHGASMVEPKTSSPSSGSQRYDNDIFVPVAFRKGQSFLQGAADVDL